VCWDHNDVDFLLEKGFKALGAEVRRVGVEDEVHGILRAEKRPAELDKAVRPCVKDVLSGVTVCGGGHDPLRRDVGLVDPSDAVAAVDDEGRDRSGAIRTGCEKNADGTPMLMCCDNLGCCIWWTEDSLAQFLTRSPEVEGVGREKEGKEKGEGRGERGDGRRKRREGRMERGEGRRERGEG
jgi:hypothetical protein